MKTLERKRLMTGLEDKKLFPYQQILTSPKMCVSCEGRSHLSPDLIALPENFIYNLFYEENSIIHPFDTRIPGYASSQVSKITQAIYNC